MEEPKKKKSNRIMLTNILVFVFVAGTIYGLYRLAKHSSEGTGQAKIPSPDNVPVRITLSVQELADRVSV